MSEDPKPETERDQGDDAQKVCLCRATLDGSPEHRCGRMLGHDGLHRWQSADGSKKFEWS